MKQYLAGSLTPAESSEVRRRLMNDDEFFQIAVPLLSRDVYNRMRTRYKAGEKR